MEKMTGHGVRRFRPAPFFSRFCYGVGLIMLLPSLFLIGVGRSEVVLSLMISLFLLYIGFASSGALILVEGDVVKTVGNMGGWNVVVDEAKISDIVEYRPLPSGEVELTLKDGRQVRVQLHKIDKREHDTVREILCSHLPEHRGGPPAPRSRNLDFGQWRAARSSAGKSGRGAE